jgi:opacity protein-like surface antigen
MKKILLVTSVLSFSLTAYAENNYYIKGDVGMSMFNSVKEKNEDSRNISIKQDAKISPSLNIAVGYIINDTFSADISVGYDAVKFKEGKRFYKQGELLDEQGNDYFIYSPYASISRKASIPSVFINGYAKTAINNGIDVFAGIGLGLAIIDEDISIHQKISQITADSIEGDSKTNNFAYNVVLGMNYKLNNSCDIGINYKWKDFGKTKSKKHSVRYNDGYKTTKVHYRGHNLTANIKYNF